MGLEGIVSKRVTSRYKSGRSTVWLKTKCMVEGEFVVVGMEPNPGGAPFALLAREEEGELVYAGSAFVTLPQSERDRFWTSAETLKVKRPAVKFAAGGRNATFVKPEIRVRAKHMRAEGMLRHASLTKVYEPCRPIVQPSGFPAVLCRVSILSSQGTPGAADLLKYGTEGNLATLSRRLRCSRCGSHATKSFRPTSRIEGARWLRQPGRVNLGCAGLGTRD